MAFVKWSKFGSRGHLRLETDLYPSIKRYLEKLGLEVKGEVCGCDIVALSEGSPELVVIGEMKQSFTLELVLQAVDRTSACDEIWPRRPRFQAGERGREETTHACKKLCRFLGFGLPDESLPRAGSTWWRRQRHGRRDATPSGVHALSRNIVAARGIPVVGEFDLGRLR